MLISGEIDEIRFRNEENGYTILVLDAEGEPVIAVGNFPPLNEGESVQLSGAFVLHPKFGKQFKADHLHKRAPNTLDSIVRYLGSGMIKGVGPKTALSIVDAFGKAALQVIEFQPELLAKVRGISRAKAEEIQRLYHEGKVMQEAIMFLQNQNITVHTALKIYKEYGENTIANVAANPYKLIEDIEGIGFYTADKIAGEMGIGKDSDFRTRAAIIYTLQEAAEKNGNTYLPQTLLIEEVQSLGITDEARICSCIDALIIDQKIKPVEGEVAGIMLKKLYSTEKSVAAKMLKLLAEVNKIRHNCEPDIVEFERINRIQLHEHQRAAVECAVNSGVSIITGGPGTGKTTIIKCILSVTQKLRLKPMLMAPTGRAAKRLSESTGQDASTIHRALLSDAGTEEGRTKGKALACDIVVIDEFSMVDIFLLNALLHRLLQGTKIVIVGDKDQLPSVGAGNCLKDLIKSALFPAIHLSRIYRQSEDSLITVNAHAINNGEMPDLTRKNSDFFFSKCKDQAAIAERVVRLATERVPKFLALEPSKVQVLCPVKNGLAGAINLNKCLQEAMNPYSDSKANHGDGLVPVRAKGAPAELKTEQELYRVGDKVMHTANNYQLDWVRAEGYLLERGKGVFNGDMGVIEEIDLQNGSITVLFEDNRKVVYSPDIRSQLTLSYAITVHKSQGSEFEAVIIPIAGINPVIMTRNLLYTAITRAKRMVVLVGDAYYIQRMVDNNYIAQRFSMLEHFMKEMKNDLVLLYGAD